MVVFPNAKINLGLNILSKRSDGYHELETLMLPIGWSDILEVVPAKGGSTTLTITGRKVDCEPEKNLVMKAYARMSDEVELPPVDIFLHKIVPDGAGLGGGSSDAAFMLKVLNDMFSLDFTDENLASMAADLGADCPFFIYNRPMLAVGTGTTLLPAVSPFSYPQHIVVVKPNEAVSTKEAYSGVMPRAPKVALSDALADFSGSMRYVTNQFEETIFPLHPVIESAKMLLLDLGASYASMSGSGSAVYGLFDASEFDADMLTSLVAKSFPGLDFHITSPCN